MPASIFGDSFLRREIAQAALDTVETWINDYLMYFERKLYPGEVGTHFRRPTTYVQRKTFDKWPEEALPCIMAVCPGTAAAPTKTGEMGRYDGPVALGMAVVVSGVDRNDTEEIADVMTACCRLIMTQQKSLGGVAAGTAFVSERYDEIPSNQSTVERTLGAGQVAFEITPKKPWAESRKGPLEPTPPDQHDPDDPGLPALGDNVIIDIDPRGIQEDIDGGE